MKIIRNVICLIILIIVLGMIFSYRVMESLPVASDDLKRIELNMTKDAVKDILGMPTKIDEFDYHEEWIYSQSPKWTTVTIIFNSDEKIEDVEIDR